MAKTVKMGLFGRPGTGKSTFAAKAPRPFFICTDGNFEWLGLPEKNHVQVSTWKQAKDVINNIVLNKPEYKDFDTIVVDLLEDLYVWAEDEFCKREGIIHIGDYKSMGAGYSVVRKEFFAQISKLLSINRNVLLLSHEADKLGKTKAGADEYMYIPSDKMSLTKQWNDIEGQVRYFLRCFTEDEEVDGRIRKKRYLSLIPGKGEYGICRGADEETWPREIELDWNVFATVIGIDNTTPAPTPAAEPVEEKKPEKPKVIKTPKPTPAVEEKKPDPAPAQEEAKPDVATVEVVKEELVEKEPESTQEVEVIEEKPVMTKPADTSKMTPAERAALVKARIQAMKEGKK